MKSHQQRKTEATRRLNKQIWKALGIEKAIKRFGFSVVKQALNAWVNYQRENAKLLREKRQLEVKLADIEQKL